MLKLFVIMPFGRKRHDGHEYDFDSAYRTAIRPAAQEVGWDVGRIDEISAPGVITDQYLAQLLNAELVLADISIPNANVYYELGIRHSVSSSGTLLISSATTDEVPFDLRGQRIIFFDRSSVVGIENLRRSISTALSEFNNQVETSPLRPFLERAGVVSNPKEDRGAFELDIAARIERARNPEQLIALWKWLEPLSPLPVVRLRDLAERLSDCREWIYATEVLQKAISVQPGDFELHRRYGWFLQQASPEHDEDAIAAYARALSINPNDPETLGLMGGSEKRRRNFAAAAELYRRGALLAPNNLYMLVNEAAMAILMEPSAPSKGINLYRALRERIARITGADEWSHLLVGEACFAIGEFREAEAAYSRAAELATSPKPLRSAADQLDIFASVSFQPTQAEDLATHLRGLATAVESGVLPEHVSPGTQETSPFLIHLSDIHFGSKGPGEKSVHRFFRGENSQPLTEHIREEFDRVEGYFKVDSQRLYLIVSGDLAYRAVGHEFSEAKDCLNNICACLCIPKERVVIVPGNHDVNWALSQDDRVQRFDHFLRFVFDFYGLDLCKRKFPLIDWPLGYDKKHPEGNEIVSIHRDPIHDILFLGLNSCVYETHQDHFGFVGERQIKAAKKLVATSGATRSTVRVAVIHHHIHPYPELLVQRDPSETWHDVSTIRDAGFVEQALEDLEVDFVLHGHKHKPQFRETLVRNSSTRSTASKRLIVCGAGSASCTELEEEEQNQYQVIELKHPQRIRDVEFAKLEWRTLSRRQGSAWVTARTWDIRG